MTANKMPEMPEAELGYLRQRATISAAGCWEGRVAPGRYTTISIKGRSKRAHRLAWEAVNGAIPDGLHVCHRCNNKRCFNPEHLYLGTNSENMRDAWRDGLRLRSFAGAKGRAQGLSLEARLDRGCIPVTETGCWLWTGSIDSGGYGQMAMAKKLRVRVHRVAYEVFVGPIPAEMMVVHKCGAKPCCNPGHLLMRPLTNLTALEQEAKR